MGIPRFLLAYFLMVNGPQRHFSWGILHKRHSVAKNFFIFSSNKKRTERKTGCTIIFKWFFAPWRAKQDATPDVPPPRYGNSPFLTCILFNGQSRPSAISLVEEFDESISAILLPPGKRQNEDTKMLGTSAKQDENPHRLFLSFLPTKKEQNEKQDAHHL